MRYEELSDPNEKRRYRRGCSIPRFEYITPERIQNELNSLIKGTQLNKYYRHEITSERIERCARLIVKECGLSIKIPDLPKPFVYKGSDKELIFRYRKKFTQVIYDMAVELGLGRYLDKAFNMFDYRLRKIGIDLIATNGHERKPSVVAAAFVYLASKKTGKKITFRAVQKAVGCGTKSLQKTLELLN
jgi:transcription initiation factor TFIIIB Brf1 subunit/transcription initiation factor TFIIB